MHSAIQVHGNFEGQRVHGFHCKFAEWEIFILNKKYSGLKKISKKLIAKILTELLSVKVYN